VTESRAYPSDESSGNDTRLARVLSNLAVLAGIGSGVTSSTPPVGDDASEWVGAITADMPWATWTIRADGGVRSATASDRDGLRGLLAARATGDVVLAVTAAREAGDPLRTWRRTTGSRLGRLGRSLSGVEHGTQRALTLPYLVPEGWDSPTQRAGWFAAPLRQSAEPALVLACWEVSLPELRRLAREIDGRIRADRDGVGSVDRVRTMLERLLDPRRLAPDARPSPRFADALRGWEQFVDDLEDRFRDGESLTRDESVRVEQVLQELVMHADTFPSDGRKAERLGLEKRLARVLDAQAARDSQGTLANVIGALTALVLVPGLVAGVYGANVGVPYAGADSRIGFRVMLAFMLGGGVLTLLLVASVRASTATRRLVIAPPGHPGRRPDDRTWSVGVGFTLLLGASLATARTALLGTPGGARLDSVTSTTQLLLWACILLTGLAGVAMIVRDLWMRHVLHALLTVAAGATGILTAQGLLHTNYGQLIFAAALAMGLAIASLPGSVQRKLAAARWSHRQSPR
jgi:hypothetical protein